MATSSSPSLMHDMMRGLRGRCPKCGRGRMFTSFLKVADACPACGEPLHHHRADDLPAYFVILLLGHLLVPIVCAVELNFSPPLWISLCIWLPLTLILALAMLQPIKGAVVALQWRMGMHGFAEARRVRQGATVTRD